MRYMDILKILIDNYVILCWKIYKYIWNGISSVLEFFREINRVSDRFIDKW